MINILRRVKPEASAEKERDNRDRDSRRDRDERRSDRDREDRRSDRDRRDRDGHRSSSDHRRDQDDRYERTLKLLSPCAFLTCVHTTRAHSRNRHHRSRDDDRDRYTPSHEVFHCLLLTPPSSDVTAEIGMITVVTIGTQSGSSSLDQLRSQPYQRSARPRQPPRQGPPP